jgi:hypothetical protein
MITNLYLKPFTLLLNTHTPTQPMKHGHKHRHDTSTPIIIRDNDIIQYNHVSVSVTDMCPTLIDA